jgi:hypothetical protein
MTHKPPEGYPPDLAADHMQAAGNPTTLHALSANDKRKIWKGRAHFAWCMMEYPRREAGDTAEIKAAFDALAYKLIDLDQTFLRIDELINAANFYGATIPKLTAFLRHERARLLHTAETARAA